MRAKRLRGYGHFVVGAGGEISRGDAHAGEGNVGEGRCGLAVGEQIDHLALVEPEAADDQLKCLGRQRCLCLFNGTGKDQRVMRPQGRLHGRDGIGRYSNQHALWLPGSRHALALSGDISCNIQGLGAEEWYVNDNLCEKRAKLQRDYISTAPHFPRYFTSASASNGGLELSSARPFGTQMTIPSRALVSRTRYLFST